VLSLVIEIMCAMLLTPDRLKSFSDSVIVVAVVLLVYNLATLANTEPNAFQAQIFLSTLVTYGSSFIVVFFFWLTFTTLIEYIKKLNDIVISLSIIFLILVTLTPVGNVLQQERQNEKSLLFTSLIQISAGALLLIIFFYVTGGKVPPSHVARITLSYTFVIPSVYTVCLLVSFLNYTIAQLLTYCIIPVFVIIRIRLQKKYPNENNELV
jgi:uncharacterized membrane protein